jgi:hypothetical protein
MNNTHMLGFTSALSSKIARWPLSSFTTGNQQFLGPVFNYNPTGALHLSALALNKNWVMMSMSDYHQATVSTGYDASATSIVMTTGHAAYLHGPNVFPWNVVWWNDTDYPDGPASDPNGEIVTVTNRVSDTLTVTRGQGGTSASTKNTGAKTYKMKPAAPFNRELALVSTTGDGSVYRFVHNRAIFVAYESAPFGNISRDGKFAAFSSNWGVDGGRTDVFLVSIPNSPAALPVASGRLIAICM